MAHLIVFSPQLDYKTHESDKYSEAFQTDYIVVSKAPIAVSNKNAWFNHIWFGLWSHGLATETAGVGHYEDPLHLICKAFSGLRFPPLPPHTHPHPSELHDGRGGNGGGGVGVREESARRYLVHEDAKKHACSSRGGFPRKGAIGCKRG